MALSVTALFLGGALVGYGWAEDRHRPSRPAATLPADVLPLAEEPPDEPVAQMPDVVGLSRVDALEALADAGIDTRVVSFEERPYVGETGRVVVQDPVRGASDPEEIVLSLSTEARVPAVVDTDIDEATAALEALGAIVVRNPVYRAGETDGTVVAARPAPGAALTDEVTLDVATPPSSVFIDALDPVSGGCSTGEDSVNGTTSAHALSCDSDSDGDPAASYDLGRKVDLFRTVAGISDAADVGDRVRMLIVVDGVEKASAELTFGTSSPIEVVTTGALRLDIVVIPVGDDSSFDAGEAVLLDAALLGSPTAISELTR